ncbi:MAG: malate synthase G [Aestuariibacter sp.]
MQYITKGQLSIHPDLYRFVNEEALQDSGLTPDIFWQRFEQLLATLQPENTALLEQRDRLQAQLDSYHIKTPEASAQQYKAFLQEIGYLVDAPEEVAISTQNVDPEVATMAGPQLVVPINNARYALNAANARWGSLYDALYGTDVIAKPTNLAPGYDETRGAQVITWVRDWLDKHFPLHQGSHKAATAYCIENAQLQITLENGDTTHLNDPSAFVAFAGNKQTPENILLKHHGLHVEIQFDATSVIGKTDKADIKDVILESALSTIMDCEDSVAAVDGEDKTLVYRNWLGLIKGNLTTEMQKGDRTITRTLAEDRQYQCPNGEHLTLPGRSLMFIRNVGHLMRNNAIRYQGDDVFEGIMDAMITCLIAKQDVLGQVKFGNSRHGSIYIVKPKMHGPAEVAFADKLFSCVEEALEMPGNTIKMGIMDEERRTSANLKACISAAQQRVAFINTGFLDRTGDEIHTSMLLGPFHDKTTLKKMPWIQAYEKSNVARGLECGLAGVAQIGKGMWPEPDNMASMMATKAAHPKAGANTAWVPSPTAATLHAMHYHDINVPSVQQQLAQLAFDGLDEILQIPVMDKDVSLSDDVIQHELDNNVQGILGYVVRWVHQGVGCSKVPDLRNVGLMEDRATLRISSQHIANWLHHNIVTKAQVQTSMQKMAALVDEQNAYDPDYIAMQPDTSSSIAFQAAEELIFAGKEQPNGYTEPVLHKKRLEMKARLAS